MNANGADIDTPLPSTESRGAPRRLSGIVLGLILGLVLGVILTLLCPPGTFVPLTEGVTIHLSEPKEGSIHLVVDRPDPMTISKLKQHIGRFQRAPVKTEDPPHN